MSTYYQIFEGCYTHTNGLDLDTAYEILEQLTNTFPHKEFYISPDYDYEDRLKEEERVYNNNAVDGWEDLFNY
jgi:hypothetical protein